MARIYRCQDPPNLIIFLIPWLLLTAGALGVLLLPGATHGLIPYTAIMALEMLITTLLIVVAGIITESQAWTTAGIFFSSLGINVLGYVFAHLPGISKYMWGTQVHWSSTAWIAGLRAADGSPAARSDVLHSVAQDRFSLMANAQWMLGFQSEKGGAFRGRIVAGCFVSRARKACEDPC